MFHHGQLTELFYQNIFQSKVLPATVLRQVSKEYCELRAPVALLPVEGVGVIKVGHQEAGRTVAHGGRQGQVGHQGRQLTNNQQLSYQP